MPTANPLYTETFPDRLETFRVCEREPLELTEGLEGIPEDERMPQGIEHSLHHEAESVYWVIFNWLLFAQPAEEPSSAHPAGSEIPAHTWTGLKDIRGRDTITNQRRPRPRFRPRYEPLEGLITTLSEFLQVDPYWVRSRNPWSRPDFVHECMSRTLSWMLRPHLAFVLSTSVHTPGSMHEHHYVVRIILNPVFPFKVIHNPRGVV